MPKVIYCLRVLRGGFFMLILLIPVYVWLYLKALFNICISKITIMVL